MTRRLAWGKSVRWACAGVAVLAFVETLAACSTLLGIDSGLPLDDAGDTPDVANVPDTGAVIGSDADIGGDAGQMCDAGRPDPFFCNGRCGKVTDRCGNSVECGTTCEGNLVCNPANHLCECSAPDWCHGRCDKSIDYCGVEQTCICPNGSVCNHSIGFCGNCIPNPLACNGKNCGYADNGCAKQPCGSCGTGQVCRHSPSTDTAGTCCTPKLGPELCQGKCSGTVVDPCTDRSYDCSNVNHCAATEQCQNTACCLRNDQACDLQGEPCCSGHCAAPADAGDGAVTPQVCVP